MPRNSKPRGRGTNAGNDKTAKPAKPVAERVMTAEPVPSPTAAPSAEKAGAAEAMVQALAGGISKVLTVLVDLVTKPEYRDDRYKIAVTLVGLAVATAVFVPTQNMLLAVGVIALIPLTYAWLVVGHIHRMPLPSRPALMAFAFAGLLAAGVSFGYAGLDFLKSENTIKAETAGRKSARALEQINKFDRDHRAKLIAWRDDLDILGLARQAREGGWSGDQLRAVIATKLAGARGGMSDVYDLADFFDGVLEGVRSGAYDAELVRIHLSPAAFEFWANYRGAYLANPGHSKDVVGRMTAWYQARVNEYHGAASPFVRKANRPMPSLWEFGFASEAA